MSIELSPNESAAWDSYASAALSGAIVDSESADQAIDVATDLADRLLLERRKRIEAYNDMIP